MTGNHFSEPFWMAPRRLRRLVEDGEIPAAAFSLLMYLGLADRDGEGIVTSRELLAAMFSVSTKTISRSLVRLTELGLVVSDLRSGVTTFRLRLGEAAKRATSDTTSDTTPPREVRGDLGQGGGEEGREAAGEAENGESDLGHSRARAETETETKTKTSALPPTAQQTRARGWPEGLGRRTLGDLLAACELVEDLQSGIDEGTVRAFVVDELAKHDEFDFFHVLSKLRRKRARGGVGDPPEPIRNEAAFARRLLQDIEGGYEWVGRG